MAESRAVVKLPIQTSATIDFIVTIVYLPADVKSSMIANTQADGTDIYFKSNAGAVLDRDLVYWDKGTGTIICKVRIPSYQSNFIYMYWGGAAVVAARNTAVYRSEIKAQYSYDEASGTAYDNTGNNNDGTAVGTPTYSQTAVVNKGIHFNTTDGFNLGHGASISGNTVLDISTWIKQDLPIGIYDLFGKCVGNYTGDEFFCSLYSHIIRMNLFDASQSAAHIGRTGPSNTFGISLEDNQFHHVRFTFDGTPANSSGVKIEIDRVRVDNANDEANASCFEAIESTATDLKIGKNPGYGNSATPSIHDEFILLNAIRSDVEIDAILANEIGGGQDWYEIGAIETARTVTYDGNGNTGGAVPTDSTVYTDGLTVTTLGNTGSLVKTGYTFSKWNTAANGSGTDRTPAGTWAMGSADVKLYAQWTALGTATAVKQQGGLNLGITLGV